MCLNPNNLELKCINYYVYVKSNRSANYLLKYADDQPHGLHCYVILLVQRHGHDSVFELACEQLQLSLQLFRSIQRLQSLQQRRVFVSNKNQQHKIKYAKIFSYLKYTYSTGIINLLQIKHHFNMFIQIINVYTVILNDYFGH